MRCPSCSYENPESHRFCGECGTALAPSCPNCGAVASVGQRFCGECGASLTETHDEHPVGSTTVTEPSSPESERRLVSVLFAALVGFTTMSDLECGASLTETHDEHPVGSTTVTEPSSPESERRLVSVLFADLVGFTTMSETRDTEEVRDLLSRFYDVCQAAVDSYGGTVDKFIGDGLLAVWGIPSDHEDDAERAVR